MHRMTVLEMVQSILSSMVSDNVNSIEDAALSTQEAQDVLLHLRDTYFEICARDDWSFLKTVGRLDAYGDLDFPNYLVSPVSVSQINNVRYEVTRATDTKRTFKDIDYLEPQSFLDYLYKRNTSDSNVIVVVDASGVPLFVRNDKAPEYYTSFDDKNLVFDSYDSAVDSALQNSKSVVLFVKSATWVNEDNFIPELPIQMFPLLLAEAKQACFNYIKQSDTPKDAKRAYRHSSHARHGSKRISNKQPRQGFGRNKR